MRRGLSAFLLMFLFIFAIATTPLTSQEACATDSVSHVTDSDGAAGEDKKLSGLINIALSDNPGLEATRLAWERSLQKYPQATALDDPLLSYTEAFQEVETRLGPNRRSVMLSQKLPFPGKRSLKGKIAVLGAKAAHLTYIGRARDLVLEVKKVYYEIYYIDKARELSAERIKILTHLTRAGMNDYSVGRSGFSKAVSAETRLADAEYDLILFEELRRSLTGRMNALLSRSTHEPVGTVGSLEAEGEERALSEIYELTEGHDSVVAAGITLEKRGLEEELAGFAWRPEFTVGLKYTDIGEPQMGGINDGGRDGVAATVALSLPLWGRKNRAATKEAALMRMGSERERDEVLETLKSAINKAYSDMRSSKKLTALYSDSLLPKSEKLVKTVEITYKNGNGSISDLFEARSMWIDFSIAHHRAESNYLKNLAELERLTAGYVFGDERFGKSYGNK